MTVRRRVPLIVTSIALLALPLASAALAEPTPGAPGAGDAYFPRQGNGGYDVSDYNLDLTYDPDTRLLKGVERVTATATQDLSRFDLDLRTNLVVHTLAVDGADADYSQPKSRQQELIVTPRAPITSGSRFRVMLTYGGKVKAITDPDGSPDGFIPTDDGAFVANEPQGSPSWYAVNDTPTDKATFHMAITVPGGLAAISNGTLLGVTQNTGTKTWHWLMGRPISSYLATATIGRFDLTFGKTPSGLPYTYAVDPRQSAASAANLKKVPAIIAFFESKYGKYPWGSTGVIVDDAPNIGYALETATRPLFPGAPDELTLSHELAHQWFGDSVTLTRWRGIWLNEGFAEFSDWLWDEHIGGRTAHSRLQSLLARPASSSVWDPPPGNPGSGGEIFDNSVYERGAATLQALREKVGNATFFSIMRGWATAHAYGNATLKQFTQYAANVSGRDLTSFFQLWLYTPGKPF